MNEKPILFSGEMVRAILEDRKTQTRRVIKPQPHGLCADIPEVITGHFLNRDLGWRFEDRAGRRSHDELRCPYGVVGDRLWVRETWRELIDLGAGTNSSGNYVDHKADHLRDVLPDLNVDVKWKPSIFMPRWASRITLEIVSVRVERVKDISEKDAQAEGVITPPPTTWIHSASYRESFFELWDSINHKRGFGWNKNPWVWVIEFKKVEQ